MLLGVLLGLSALVYHMQPTLLGLLPYALFRKRNLLRAVFALATALSVPALWSRLQHGYLELPIDRANSAIAEDTLKNIGLLFSSPEKGKLYWLVVRAFSVFTQNMVYAFMTLALVLCIAGVFDARRSSERWFPLVLLCPALFLNVALTLGQVRWHDWYVAEFARFTYIAYPAVYIGAALALERIVGRGAAWPSWSAWSAWSAWRSRSTWRWAVACACIALLGLWQNADAFGFVSPTFHFYFPQLDAWLQRS